MVCIDCFPGSSAGKESTYNAGDLGSIFGSRISTGEGIGYCLQYSWASLVTQTLKNPPAMWETWIWSLGWEDPLEKGTATHSSILAWRISWTEEPGRLPSTGSQRIRHYWVTFTFTFFLSHLKGEKMFQNHPLFTSANRKENWMRKAEHS